MNTTRPKISRTAAGLQPSRRSAIAPFIVMDVMQAAAEREAQGYGVIHMEVGQPGTPAPRAALARVARRWSARRWDIPSPSVCLPCASGSPATTPSGTASAWNRSAWL